MVSIGLFSFEKGVGRILIAARFLVRVLRDYSSA